MNDRDSKAMAQAEDHEDTCWRNLFLAHLAETSDINRSAELANISRAEVFELRRRDAEFAKRWDQSLADGYAHLEMDLLRRLREGDYSTLSETKYDFTNALRLLTSFREFSSKQHIGKRTVSSAEVRATIDAKVEDLRRQVHREKSRATTVEK